MEHPPKKETLEEQTKEAIAAGTADPIDAAVYRRPEEAAAKLREIIENEQIPEVAREHAQLVLADIERTAKEARTMHTEKHEAQEASLRDELTGLPNERAFQEELGARMSHVERFTGDALYALYVDINRFKPINDTYGHAAGDRYLQLLAQHIREAFRPTDIFARLHGDEFAALLTMRHADDQADYDADVAAIAARVREAANHAKHDLQKELPTLAPNAPALASAEGEESASVGYARFDPGNDTKETFLEKADGAMYAAKGDSRR